MKLRKALLSDNVKQQYSLELFRKYLNKNTTDGNQYRYLNNGIFVLASNDGKVDMKFEAETPSDIKELGIKKQDLPELLFRSQRNLKLKNVEFEINGEKVPMDRMFQSLFDRIDFKNDSYYISPKKFDEDFNVDIYMNSVPYTFHMNRMPLLDMTHRLYKSDRFGIFSLKFYVDEVSERFNFTLEYDIKSVENIDELINNEDMILNFISGDVRLDDKRIDFKRNELDDLKEIFSFYKMVKDVSQKVTINNMKISDDIKIIDYINLQKLYISFVKDDFYYIPEKYENISLTFESNIGNQILNKEMYITAYSVDSFKVLNTNFKLYEQYVFKNVKAFDYEETKNKEYKFNLKVSDDGFKYSKLFLEEKENTKPSENLLREIDKAIEIKTE